MTTYLDSIVDRRRRDLADRKAASPLARLKARAKDSPPAVDFRAALRRPGGIGIIAEFKRASPSHGPIAPDADPVAVARSYARAGAAAISVLTEEPSFMGSVDHLLTIKRALGKSCPPLLRKDFIIDPYQVYESRAYRADALLLIVACLSDGQLQDLLGLSRELGLGCLVEVHTEDEAGRAAGCGAQIVGINNRDLRTFVTDLETTRRVRPAIPQGKTVVSESGIKSRADVARLTSWGVHALLIGEAFMASPDPGAKLREFLSGHE